MSCECGNPLSDFHDAFTRGLCWWCYKSAGVVKREDHVMDALRYDVKKIEAYVPVPCCLAADLGGPACEHPAYVPPTRWQRFVRRLKRSVVR